MAKEKERSFEEAVRELEQLVKRMESGHLSLDESLQTFEQGIKLSRECENKLSGAKNKIEVLLKQAGESKLVPFSVEESDI